MRYACEKKNADFVARPIHFLIETTSCLYVHTQRIRCIHSVMAGYWTPSTHTANKNYATCKMGCVSFLAMHWSWPYIVHSEYVASQEKLSISTMEICIFYRKAWVHCVDENGKRTTEKKMWIEQTISGDTENVVLFFALFLP